MLNAGGGVDDGNGNAASLVSICGGDGSGDATSTITSFTAVVDNTAAHSSSSCMMDWCSCCDGGGGEDCTAANPTEDTFTS